MTPERHALIRTVFLEAASLPADQRSTLLERRCGADADLRIEVEKLLAHQVPETIASPGLVPRSVTDGGAQTDSRLEPDAEQPTLAAPRDARPFPPVGPPGETVTSRNRGDPNLATVVVGRYRLVELLGQGGMGTVYRADDLTLDQPVAVKFLDPRFASRPDWIERFRNEVRLARIVTHPNVCRVFDIGEAGNQVFLSMEYIEGGDLASLMRRKGRLPEPQAVELAGQVCTGLAAAHGAGVLHRDLKPANIMVNERGQVRLTDFGVAVAVDGGRGREIRVGTPAYMAPEQISGRAVDVRSDIYALGLVLYELFSGQPAFRADSLEEYVELHEHGEPQPLSGIAPDLDPGVEELVHACLRKDPNERPQSALAVAASLPGVDVLAVALSAKQMPTVELVAGASQAAVRVGRPGWLTLFVLTACGVLPMLRATCGLPWDQSGGDPPAVLAGRAREILATVGNARAGAQHAFGFCSKAQAIAFLADNRFTNGEESRLAVTDAELVFWMREAMKPLVPQSAETLVLGNSRASLRDPPKAGRDEGMVLLDQHGRLLALVSFPSSGAIPAWQTEPADAFRWTKLLVFAGLTSPELLSGSHSLEGAIEGESCERWHSPGPADRSLEALGCLGRDTPTRFLAIDRGLNPARVVPSRGPKLSQAHVGVGALRILFLVGMLLSVPLAWRNHKKNRGDRGGGLKIATFVLLLQMTAWLVGADHAYEFTTELGLTCVAFLRAMAFAAVVFVLYMALEPLARRYWPHMLIGWARLLYLRRSDPLVWQHVLVGLAVGCLWALFFAMDWALVRAVGLPVTEPFLARQAADRLVGGRAAVAALLQSIVLALWQGLVFATLLALVRAVVRKPLVAVFLVGVLLLAVLVPRGANPITSLFFTGLGATAVGLWALTRFGLLAVIVAAAATMMLNAAPMRFDQQGWVGGQGPALLILVCGVALIAFRYARRQVAPQRTCV